MEIDEETDPDYNPTMFNGQPYQDREEFQSANVSKKELNDLKDELFECLKDIPLIDMNVFGDILEPTMYQNLNQNQPSTSAAHDFNESLITPVKEITDRLETPNKILNQSVNETLSHEPLIQNVCSPAMNYFDPRAISTPTHRDVPQIVYDFSNYVPFSHLEQTPGISYQHSDSFNNSFVTMNDNSLSQSQYPFNFIPFSTFKNANSSIMSSEIYNVHQPYPHPQIIQPDQTVMSASATSTTISQSSQGRTKKKHGWRSKIVRFKAAKYPDLENLNPNIIQINQNAVPYCATGFTDAQRLILEQQLRIHVQLSTQNYIQTHGHPELHKKACVFKQFLVNSQLF